jgi:hypothetical protein
MGDRPSTSQQLIRELRSFFGNYSRETPPFDRPSDWYCPDCNVWGRDMPPAACWCCGAEDVDYRVAPSMTGGQRFHVANVREWA